jgi:deoxyribodipyrimidine photolyase-related protein
MNRQKMPKNVKVPNLLSNSLKDDKKYIDEAVKYVNKNFKNNYGNTDNFQFPISHKVAEKWLHDFLKNKLAKFGDYQDFIYDNEPYLLHSCLSTSINIGLINPLEIIKELEKYKNKVAINSFEGYLRQLYWREYQRYTYIYCDFSGNYFGYKKKIDSTWYTGDTGMEPVDNFIKMGFDTGYLHHIIRLMIMGNYMNLYGLSPKDGFRWFMEFSCDSYEWVMSQNVLDMVFFVTGGKTMRKPYISSSNYIIKMSNYKKGEWSEEWDKMYRKFMEDRLDKLWKFRYSFPALKKIKEGK